MVTPRRIQKSGKTYYRVQIRRPTKGITVDEHFSTKRAADRFIREVESAISDGKPIVQNVRQRESFAGALDAYLADPQAMETRKGKPLRPSSRKDRIERLRWLSKNCFGQVLLKRLTWQHIDDVLTETKIRLTWAPATRYRYESALSRFLDYASKRGWVAYNVAKDQDRLNITGARNRTYTDDEWRRLVQAAEARGDMLAMFLRLSWATGARKSELLRLRWLDVEPIEHDTLGARIEIRDTKNDEDRDVFITDSLYKLLQAHEQQFRKPSSDLVFPSRVKRGRYQVNGPFQEARLAAGLEVDEKHGETLTIHHIRHTWATRLGERGASLAQLMAAGGWRTPGMVARYMKSKAAQSAEAAVLLSGGKDA
jgi:integrase|tara:strand:- start:164 stop:1267 length:1104 start_codon:yes stop_codon:yes gene_type:complete